MTNKPMMDNNKESGSEHDGLEIWKQLEETDPSYTKGFDRGGYKGTSINPTYCYRKLTEVFGPIGFGWRVEESKSETFAVPVPEGGEEVILFKDVQLFVKMKGEWSAPIIGHGGDYIISYIKPKQDRPAYFKLDDEAHKKCFTDALTNAMKMLGMSADVHMGEYDDSKYVNDLRAKYKVEEAKGPVVEFAFAVEKAETKPPWGKPKEYWEKWNRAIAAGRAKAIKKVSNSGKELDAWEVESLDVPEESASTTKQDAKHPAISAGEARTQAFLSGHGNKPQPVQDDSAIDMERKKVRQKQDSVAKLLGATTDHIFDFYRGYFGDPLPMTLSGSACLDALDRLTASAEDIRGSFSKDPRTIGQNIKAQDVLKKLSQSGTREGPQPQSTTGLEEQLKASIAMVEGKAKPRVL